MKEASTVPRTRKDFLSVLDLDPVELERCLDLATQVKAVVAQGIRDAIMIPNKTARQERLDLILKDAIEKHKQPDDPNRERHIKVVFHGLEYTEVRNMILEKGSRADGR